MLNSIFIIRRNHYLPTTILIICEIEYRISEPVDIPFPEMKTDITAGSYVLREINFKIEAGSKSKLTVALSRCLLILSILFGIIFAFKFD